MIKIALFQPDIPQNVGAMMRLCACMGCGLEIIEPCGFPWDTRKIRQSALDYYDYVKLTRHDGWAAFTEQMADKGRIILLTTKGDRVYTDFTYQPGDVLLAGRESAGAPDYVHQAAAARLMIPMRSGFRSMNIVNATAMVLGEALRQTGFE